MYPISNNLIQINFVRNKLLKKTVVKSIYDL